MVHSAARTVTAAAFISRPQAQVQNRRGLSSIFHALQHCTTTSTLHETDTIFGAGPHLRVASPPRDSYPNMIMVIEHKFFIIQGAISTYRGHYIYSFIFIDYNNPELWLYCPASCPKWLPCTRLIINNVLPI